MGVRSVVCGRRILIGLFAISFFSRGASGGVLGVFGGYFPVNFLDEISGKTPEPKV